LQKKDDEGRIILAEYRSAKKPSGLSASGAASNTSG
jgi:hypothetical protein